MRSTQLTASLAIAAAIFFGVTASTTSPRFLGDDPLVREPNSQDASQAQESEIGDLYEMVYNLFEQPKYQPSGLRAQNINSVDEVPDSSWFTNRVTAQPLTAEDLVRGPNVGAPPDPSKWVIFREKTSGVHPGFTARDAKGETWFLEFDPPFYPEGATAALLMAS